MDLIVNKCIKIKNLRVSSKGSLTFYDRCIKNQWIWRVNINQLSFEHTTKNESLFIPNDTTVGSLIN